MAVSKKTKEMMTTSSWIRKMFEEGAELKSLYGADKVYDFSIGNPNIEPPEEFQTVLEEEAARKIPRIHAYMPNAGYLETRESVARYLSEEQGVEIGPEMIVMTVGAAGGMNVALKSVLNPGDRVLVSTPYFMEYASYVDNQGGTLVLVASKENFDPDIQELESNIDENTAGIIINSPNNPTGAVYSAEVLEELGKMLTRKSKEIGRTLYLFSDEPYRKIVYNNYTVPSVFAHYPHSFVITSYSKDLSLPGERIGFVALHPEAEDRENIIAGCILANRILGFVNAPALMQRVVARLQGITADVEDYQRKRDLLSEGLRSIGYDFEPPAGTFYLFPKAPGGDEMAVIRALQEERILAVPGGGFAAPGYFRLAFCVEDKVITGAMPGFEKVFNKFRL